MLFFIFIYPMFGLLLDSSFKYSKGWGIQYFDLGIQSREKNQKIIAYIFYDINL